MKKSITILLIIVIGVIAFVSVYLLCNKPEEKNVLVLSYSNNGGVPYEWQFEIGNKEIIEFVKSEIVEDNNKNGMVGAPYTTEYTFKGIKSGVTTITFRYVSLTDGTVVSEKKHTVNVGSDLVVSEVIDISE